MRETVLGELATADGQWRVQVVERPRGAQWYRLITAGGEQRDGLSIATVTRLLGEAGVDMSELQPVDAAA